MTWRHTSVVMVKPGGTGNPSDAISARLAPLPPSSALSVARPSALPPPNCLTYLVIAASSCRRPQLAEVADPGERLVDRSQQREPVLAQALVGVHHHDATLVEE